MALPKYIAQSFDTSAKVHCQSTLHIAKYIGQSTSPTALILQDRRAPRYRPTLSAARRASIVKDPTSCTSSVSGASWPRELRSAGPSLHSGFCHDTDRGDWLHSLTKIRSSCYGNQALSCAWLPQSWCHVRTRTFRLQRYACSFASCLSVLVTGIQAPSPGSRSKPSPSQWSTSPASSVFMN